MLSSSLLTLSLATIGAYAEPVVNTVGGLDLFLSTPADNIAFVSDLRVISTVKNIGYEGLKILKLGTVLDNEHPTHAFTVTKDGKEVPFNTTSVTPPSDHISENDWVVIPAGENVTSQHDVSALYNFSGSGPGTFAFDPVSRFRVIGVNDTVETASGASSLVIANAHSVSITVSDDASKLELKREKPRTKVDCLGSQWSQINASVTEARSMAGIARTHIRDCGANDQLFKSYFGTNSDKTVIDNFDLILNANSPSPVNQFCSGDPSNCTISHFAYHNDSGIFYCNKFYDQRGVKRIKDFCKDKSDHAYRGGTTLRMLATYFFFSVDFQQGCGEAEALDNEFKILSVDNYECFAMEAIRRSWCSKGDDGISQGDPEVPNVECVYE